MTYQGAPPSIRAKARAATRECAARRRERFEREGTCTNCGKSRSPQKKLCALCLERSRASYRKHATMKRAAFRAVGICYDCREREAMPKRKRCGYCAEKEQERKNANRAIRVATPRQLGDFLLPRWQMYPDHEVFGLILVDECHHILWDSILLEGSRREVPIQVRDILRGALTFHADARQFVVWHNHPSGDPCPSRPDESLTRRLIMGGKAIGMDLLDHCILGDGRYHSFRAVGAIP